MSRLKLRHVLAFAVFGALLTFQNCSSPLDTTPEDQFNEHQQNLPFAFVATVDTISYMSCTNMTTSTMDTTAYYTFRAGAFRGGAGISLTNNYLYNTAYDTADLRAQGFSQSEANVGAIAQLAIRQKGQYQNALAAAGGGDSSGTDGTDGTTTTVGSGTGGTVEPGLDTGNFLMELDENPIASQIGALQSGQWQNTFQGNSIDYQNNSGQMFASLIMMDSETSSLTIREDLQGGNQQGFLTVTFTGTGSPSDTSARGPFGAIQAEVYGMGYRLGFQQGCLPSGCWSQGDNRVLGPQVTEFDLGGDTLPGSPHGWTCPSSLEFMIVQPSDLIVAGGSVECTETADPTPLDVSLGNYTQAQYETVQTMRTVLPVWDWFIDVQHNCVVPTNTVSQTSCYGDRTGLAPIDYTPGSCQAFTPNANGGIIGNCPHWVSVCTRN